MNYQISAFKWSVFRTVYVTELRATGFLEYQETEVLYFIQFSCVVALGYEVTKVKIRTAQEGKLRGIKIQTQTQNELPKTHQRSPSVTGCSKKKKKNQN